MSAWEPLRHRAFRILFIAQFASNVGTWMQTVGAQWLMGDLGGGALQVALVQTATSLPIFLLVLPSGALGDILDRRRVLLASQSVMLVSAGLLAALTASGAMTPWLLLGLTFAVGSGQALAIPSWQAIQPELVPRAQIPQSAVLNGANFNVARAVGPAIGGLLISGVGAQATFALNALSFVGVLCALLLWGRPADRRALGVEHLRAAIGAGARYVRNAPLLRVVLWRSTLFMTFASALWALLPVVARGPLELGADGYGLLFASVGIGAVTGALLLPWLRSRLDVNLLVAMASGVFAAACLVVGLVELTGAVVAALVAAGMAWIAVLSSLNASAQLLLPSWTRARGLAFYTLTFMGAQAVGSVLWGTLAGLVNLETAFSVAAAGLLIGPALGRRRLRLTRSDLDLEPTAVWGEPHLTFDASPDDGPVLVTVEWRVREQDADAFQAAMRPVERVRRRTGATRWGLFQDGEDPERFLETFTVATWLERQRQHLERVTVRDDELEARARELTVDGEPPRVRHLLAAYRGPHG